MGVQAIIVIEDNVRFYSSFLPAIYAEVTKHTRSLVPEGVNVSHKLMRIQARPKILLCRTFEEAWDYFERYQDHVLGVISDVEFPKHGKLSREAGVEFARHVRERQPDIPVMLQSSVEANAALAESVGASFLLKGSPLLLNQLRQFMIDHFGFGEFVFRMPGGREVGRASDLKGLEKPETPLLVSILVFEDLAMAAFLPVTSVLLLGGGLITGAWSVLVAVVTVGAVLFLAIRYGKTISRLVYHGSDEVTLLTVLGIILLVAGVAQQLQVSAAIGSFLVGIALSEPIAGHARRLLSPLRDLFAAIFFLFFGLEIDPSTLPPVLLGAAGLAAATLLTKVLTGWLAARRSRLDALAGLRAGAALVAHGEFSIVIAGLAVSAGLEPGLRTFSAAYVLLLAVVGPFLARLVEPLYSRLLRTSPSDARSRP
jgi:hypothetical protein